MIRDPRDIEIERLRRRVAELEEELAAHEGAARDDRHAFAEAARLVRCRDAMRALPAAHSRAFTLTHARVLLALVDRPGHVFSRDALFEVLGCDEEVQTKIVDVRMSAVRAALAAFGLHRSIETIWGVGYQLNADYAGPIKRIWGEGGDAQAGTA
jgi:DNA-binding response OmpR family regulator